MESTITWPGSFLNELPPVFASYAQRHPKITAHILRRMLFPEHDEPEDYAIRLKKFVCLLLLMPEQTSAEILSYLSCFEDNENNQTFIEEFFFEMARSEIFFNQTAASALSSFITASHSVIDGIDHARVLGEVVYGDKRMIEIITNLTNAITKPEEPSPDETN